MEGTVSHGTHRARDLVPAFLDAASTRLAEIEQGAAWEITGALPFDHTQRVQLVSEYHAQLGEFERAAKRLDIEDEGEEVLGLVEALFDFLDALAAPGQYFGALEGDGSDFGYWPIDDDASEAHA